MKRTTTDLQRLLEVISDSVADGLLDDAAVDLADALALTEELADARERYRLRADAVSPNVPEGYDTILGYLAKQHPDALDLIDYTDPHATTRDGYKMMHLARQTQSPVIWVEAPLCLKQAGIKQVRAYPVALLARRGW